MHRDSQGAFPPAEGGLPASERCLDQQRRQKDDYGWRVMYRIDSGGPGIRISVVPDTALDLRGPVFDTDERGLVLRRDSVGARWYAVATPIPRLMRLLVCILEKPDRVPRLGLDTTKLDDMIFGGDCDVNGFRQITEAGGVATAWDPNAARLVLTTGHARFNSTAVHDVFYRPYGLRPGRGFELVARTTNFGDTGIRSYLIESDGAVRATWEKRAPTREDPVVERCEIEPRTPCAPLRR